MSKKSKGYILNSVCLTVCGALMAAGMTLFLSASPSSVTDQQAECVTGGQVGVSIGNRNCAASTFCNQTPCVNGVCPAGTTQRTQVSQNYPATEIKGGPHKGTKGKWFTCHNIQACANPCLVSTTDGTAYCAGPVGPVSANLVLGKQSTGKKGAEKSEPKDDKDVDEGEGPR